MLDMLTEEEQKALIKLPGVDAAFLAGKNYVRTANENSEKMKKVRAAKEARTKKGNNKVWFNDLEAYSSLREGLLARDDNNVIARSEKDIKEFVLEAFKNPKSKKDFI